MVSLGETPLADAFVANSDADEPRFPLRVRVCEDCKLVQMIDEVDKKLLFNDDYGFFTGASPSSIKYFKEYAESVMSEYPEECKGLVLEIASNDGTLLKHFVDAGCEVLGVDPAANTVAVANANAIRSLPLHFDLNVAESLNRDYGRAKVIMANNVVAHIDTIHDFMEGVSKMLSHDGVFIAEVQYLPHLLFNNAFDHIYHEHRSFFSLSPLQRLFAMHGLHIVDVKKADTQGGSIRVYARRHSETPSQALMSLSVYEQLLQLDSLDTYMGMQQRVNFIREELLIKLQSLKEQGKKIYGFGASAKGNTLLNYCGIGPDLLDCIVDLTPHKIGKYTPGTHIPVKHPDEVEKPDYYLILVWNYLPGILERNMDFLIQGGHLIVPIPGIVTI
jgi:SAM-dependent methyltransferase